MAKLVVFYSRADENTFGNGTFRYVTEGNTSKAAKILAQMVGADLFEVKQKNPYSAVYKECVAAAVADWKANARPEIAETMASIDAYDEVFVGYPIYCGTMPMALCTFLEQFDWTGKTIHPFCTHEGSRLGKSMATVENCCKGATIGEGLAIRGSEAENAKDAFEGWLK